MTITSSTRSTEFNGNGSTTAFAFAWRVFATTDVQVVLTSSAGAETVLTPGTHYSVALNADQSASPGGTVTMVTAPASGETLTVISNVPYTQEVDLVNGGAFNAEVIEAGFDRVTAQVQQLNARLGEDPLGDLLDATAPLDRANRALGFDADGDLTVATGFDPGALTVSAFMETVLDDATAAAARTTLGVPTGFAATAITYSGGTSGLSATTVQAAIDELDGLVDAFESSVPAATLVTFTTPGTTSWSVPSGCTHILVEAIGAGSGGSSGSRSATRTALGGGQGGSSGEVKRALLRAPAVGTSITVTVGTGGSGGAALTADGTGNVGGVGGVSAFGGYVVAGINPSYGNGCPGVGGAGASSNTSSPYYYVAAAGQDSKGGQSTIATVSGGSAGTSGSTGTAGGAGNNASSSYTYGAGGGGGGHDTDGPGLAGGAGGYPGGGGGGGGASYGANSGAGGAGGRGEVRVWWW